MVIKYRKLVVTDDEDASSTTIGAISDSTTNFCGLCPNNLGVMACTTIATIEWSDSACREAWVRDFIVPGLNGRNDIAYFFASAILWGPRVVNVFSVVFSSVFVVSELTIFCIVGGNLFKPIIPVQDCHVSSTRLSTLFSGSYLAS